MSQPVKMPMDTYGHSVQTLAPDETTVVSIAIGADTRQPLPADSKIVEIAATGACRIKFGNSSVLAASGRLFPAGVAVYKIPADLSGTQATHIAVISESGSTGNVTIARMF
jgi:hypothetical protein